MQKYLLLQVSYFLFMLFTIHSRLHAMIHRGVRPLFAFGDPLSLTLRNKISSSSQVAMVKIGNDITQFNYIAEASRFKKFFSGESSNATSITLLENDDFVPWFDALSIEQQNWLRTIEHGTHKAGRAIMIPDLSGSNSGLNCFAFCLDEEAKSPFSLCSMIEKLPKGKYNIVNSNGSSLCKEPNTAALSWALSVYSFDRYKSKSSDESEERTHELVWPSECDREFVQNIATSIYLVRDLISTPAEDMGPNHLQNVAADMANEFGADFKVIVGDSLLVENYNMIHAVGRAAGVGREPRLIDITWGHTSNPKVTLVGKGVCFDTGGLDIKPSAGMLTMKKDMGGAAQVLGLARLIMSNELPVRLRILIPAVENNINGNSFRPGDILTSKSGKTTEIGNTDAEGRLVLGDCLFEACSEDPELVIDCATLTGAARVALGTDVPVLFCNNDKIANDLLHLSTHVHDQIWRLPLWESYRSQISSKLADIKNVGSGAYGGAITAALYLDEFVGHTEKAKATKKFPAWIHLDFMAYNTVSRPGRPEGGEAQGMRALFSLLQKLFGKNNEIL